MRNYTRRARLCNTVLGHAIPNKEALARFSDGALETYVCKHSQLGVPVIAELILL